MTLNSKYLAQVFRKDKTIKISTVSPNGKFFFKIKEPKDLYWGLFCSPISFYDTNENLIYYNKTEFAQFSISKAEEWKLVSWSSSGNFAFFIERNSTQSLQYILLNLVNKTVSKTDSSINDETAWSNELFSKLPADKAQELYHKIISAESSDKAFEHVLALNMIDDKGELIKALEKYYYSDFKKVLTQFENGAFDDKIISGSNFDSFFPIVPDTMNKGILELVGINNWRP